MATNRDRLAAKIQALPSFVTEKAPGELWLRGASSTSTWPYDVRLFLEPASLLIEISTRGEALSRDVASIHADVAREVPVRIPLDSAAHSATTRPPVPEHPAAIGAQRRVPSPGSERGDAWMISPSLPSSSRPALSSS